MRLTDEQLRAFGHDGSLVVPGVVGEHLLAAADAEVDALAAGDPPPAGHRGKHFWFLAPECLPASAAALFDSGALALAEQLTAPRPLTLPFDHVQVALNIPPNADRPGGGHVDGHVRLRPQQRNPLSFTLLVGVFLGDESGPPGGITESGSLWVWPGSHLAHERWFAEHGTRSLMDNGGHLVLSAGAPGLGAPRVLHGRRGDVLLAHYLLAHNTGPNLTSTTRRMLYCRLAAAGHRRRWARTFTDVLYEYPPVRAALGERTTSR